jgi:hypothetical protein
MPRARARTAVASTTGLALIIGLGACGSDAPPPRTPARAAPAVSHADTRPDAAPLVHDLIAKINERGSVHSSVQGRLGLIGELTGEGVIRYTDHADVGLTGHTQMSPTQPRQRVDVTVVDGVGYLKSPLLKPEPGKPWLQVSPGGQDFAAKLLSPALTQLQDSTDPRAAFEGVENAVKVASSKPDTLDGKPVTRYDLRVLTSSAAAITHDPQTRSQMQQASASGQRELGYELWLDEAGLPVRFGATQAVAQAGEVSLSTQFRDWGTQADVKAPPQDQVGVFRDVPMPQAQPPR